MTFERQLRHQLIRLRQVIRKTVLTSRDFAGLRKLLKRGGCELQIYLVPLVVGGRVSAKDLGGVAQQATHVSLHLTQADLAFLKKAGIKF